VQVSEDDKFRYRELNAKLYRIKVVDKDLFMGVATGVPATPVCYFRPKLMS